MINIKKGTIVFQRALSTLGILLFLMTIMIGCKKNFLEARPQKSLVVPTSLDDFQALLDNQDVMNQTGYIALFGEDDFLATDAVLSYQYSPFKNSYLWSKDIYEDQPSEDWDNQYKIIFYSNIILDGLNKLQSSSSDQNRYNTIKGSGLFFRAKAHFSLSQIFCQPYNPATANQVPGIPLKLSSDVNLIASRGKLSEVRSQVIKDLEESIPLLPDFGSPITRPSKLAAYGLLARVYLDMQNYEEAMKYASLYISKRGQLVDYNSLIADAARPFPLLPSETNVETAYYDINLTTSFTGSEFFVAPELYAKYADNDLRKVVFFNNDGNFKGTYTGMFFPFTGFATDEAMLIRSECYARKGDVSSALNELNTLLVKRWKTGTFVPITASNQEDALTKILTERRKELVCRGLRWFDLRRLNQDPKYAVTLTRNYSGSIYTLKPNTDYYTFPIPNDEIKESKIEQNKRN